LSGAPSPVRRFAARLLDIGAVFALLVVIVGSVVRLTVRDVTPVFAAVYYALPWIVMSACLACAGAAWLLAGRTRCGATCLVIAPVLAGIWFSVSYHSQPCRPGPDDIRVLLLNTARGHAGWDEVARALPLFDVDIIGLVEAGGKSPARQKFWEDNFPDHHVYLPGGGLAILTRGDVRRINLHPLDGISRFVDAEIDLEGRLIRVLLVDLDASPRFDRQGLISTVFRAASSTADVPTIVMGDFNTPVDSRWFDRVRTRFEHVFEASGTGMFLTWPSQLPLVGIDHVWVSRGVEPRCATIESSGTSDHRAVSARLALSDAD
jgi:vancomycin resistance protein VanJ